MSRLHHFIVSGALSLAALVLISHSSAVQAEASLDGPPPIVGEPSTVVSVVDDAAVDDGTEMTLAEFEAALRGSGSGGSGTVRFLELVVGVEPGDAPPNREAQVVGIFSGLGPIIRGRLRVVVFVGGPSDSSRCPLARAAAQSEIARIISSVRPSATFVYVASDRCVFGLPAQP